MQPGGDSSKWIDLSSVGTGGSVDDLLAAAAADLRRAVPPPGDEAATAIALAGVEPDAGVPGLVLTVEGASGHRRRLTVTLWALERALAEQVPPLTTLAWALTRGALDGEWRPARVGRGDPPAREAFERYAGMWTRAGRRAQRQLEDHHDVLLAGADGSGKTVVALACAEAQARAAGWGVVWLDLTDPADGPTSVHATLLHIPRRDRYLVVIDNAQRNAAVFTKVLAAVESLRHQLGLPATVLATSLTSVVGRWPALFVDLEQVQVRGVELIDQLCATLPPDVRSRIRKLADGDVHLAAAARDRYDEHGVSPRLADLQRWFTHGIDDEPARKAMYWLACLGAFDLGATFDAVERWMGTADAAREVLDRLLARKLVHRDDALYRIGHGARSRLVLRHACQCWDARRWGDPAQLLWEHVRAVGEVAVRSVLGVVDVLTVGEDATGGYGETTQRLVLAWSLMEKLERQIDRGCERDPTRGDHTGAAVFAAMAMQAIPRLDRWGPLAGHVRARWDYGSRTRLPAPVGEPTRERAEFDQIVREMAREDERRPPGAPGPGEPSGTVDRDRFHRTWMLGILLGLEGTAVVPDRQRLWQLLDAAAGAQDDDGWFYPKRVPWVTARVVLGLCHAGQTYASSPVVRRACGWLRLRAGHGGPFHGWWHSGTGTWNSDEATTAMCVAALRSAEVPSAAVRDTIELALAWLADREDEWRQPGREIDLALALEQLLDEGDDERGRYQLIIDLLERTVAPKAAAGGGLAPEAELRFEFVSAQLAEIVWSILRRDFRILLGDLFDKIINGDAEDGTAGSGRAAGPGPDGDPDGATGGTGAAPDAEAATATRAAATGAADTPAAGPSGVIGDADGWRAAVDRLRQAVEDKIREMRPQYERYGANSRAIAERYGRLRGYHQRCRTFLQQLAGDAPAPPTAAEIAEIDRIGRDILAELWTPPQAGPDGGGP